MKREKEQLQREHVRIGLRDGVNAVISICNVFGQEVESRHTPVLLQNMSPTGLQFLTHLRFPVNNNYTIRLLIAFNEWEFSLLANIVWRRKEENQFVYGCTFYAEPGIRQSIVFALLDKIRLMSPRQLRIHELYRRMSYAKEMGMPKLDVRR